MVNINIYHSAHRLIGPPLKRLVSCPAVGQNDGHSGGRKYFFFYTFCSLCIEMISKILGEKKILKIQKKVTHKANQPMDRKNAIFKGGLVE